MNPATLKDACHEINARMAGEVFGQDGINAVFEIMELLWDVYRHVEPEHLKGPVIVIRPIGDGSVLSNRQHEILVDFPLLIERVERGFAIEIGNDRRLRISAPDIVDIQRLAERAVIYEFRGVKERFLAGAKAANVLRLDPLAHSQFSIPTFSNLRSVLQRYHVESVRFSSCPVFSEVWLDEHRLFFKPGPEEKMRNSLTWFLKCRLGGGHEITETRPEQNMDESHPVDIKVSQSLSNRLAIVEIKWLGDSLNEGGAVLSHRDKRARDGAKQLADYLDMNKEQAPLHVTKGYYVIIDGRRRGLRSDTTAVTAADGMHYRDSEIEFDVRYEELRDDFEPPFRMFAEPKCAVA